MDVGEEIDILIQIKRPQNISEPSNIGWQGIYEKVEVPHKYQIMRESGRARKYVLKLAEESSSRTRWVIYIENIEARLTVLKFTKYGLQTLGGRHIGRS